MEYSLYKSPARAIRLLVISTCVVGFSIFLLSKPGFDTKWMCWVSIAFFSLGYPVAIFNLLDRGPQIIFNEVGVFDRTLLNDYINWDIIENAYLQTIYKQNYICLVINEQVDLSSKINSTTASLNKVLGFQELNINLAFVKVDENKLLEFVLLMIQSDKSKRAELLQLQQA